jgi:hypothetical protein
MAQPNTLLEVVVASRRAPSVPGVCGVDPVSVAVRTDVAAIAGGLTDPTNTGPSNGLGVPGGRGYR